MLKIDKIYIAASQKRFNIVAQFENLGELVKNTIFVA